MLSLSAEISIPQHVISTKVEEDAVLLNTKNNQYYTLDGVGARFWTLLNAGDSLQALHAALLEEYDVAAEDLERDLLELLEDLRRNGLVDIVEA